MGRKWTQEEKDAWAAKQKARWDKVRADKLAAKSAGNVELQTAVAPKVKAEPPAPKAPPKNLFSGTTKKLEVFGKGGDPNDPIPGFRLRWFDDVEGGLRIAQARQSGYEFVAKDEVALNDADVSPGNNDLGSNVRRWVGQNQDGSPRYAYLLKKPQWLYELHENGPDSLEVRKHQHIEAQLRGGTLAMQPGENRYSSTSPPPGSVSGLPPISLNKPR